jgi:hypothetical protein
MATTNHLATARNLMKTYHDPRRCRDREDQRVAAQGAAAHALIEIAESLRMLVAAAENKGGTEYR